MADNDAVPDINARVALLETRAAVADLVHLYALAIRNARPEDIAALFTEDASFEIRDAAMPGATDFVVRAHPRGRKAVMGYVGKSALSGFRVAPMIRNLIVTVEGDEATANSLMTSRTWPAGAEVCGEYRDSFRRVEGRWLFSGRIFTIFQRPAQREPG